MIVYLDDDFQSVVGSPAWCVPLCTVKESQWVQIIISFLYSLILFPLEAEILIMYRRKHIPNKFFAIFRLSLQSHRQAMTSWNRLTILEPCIFSEFVFSYTFLYIKAKNFRLRMYHHQEWSKYLKKWTHTKTNFLFCYQMLFVIFD